jgi:hypothetical protein
MNSVNYSIIRARVEEASNARVETSGYEQYQTGWIANKASRRAV